MTPSLVFITSVVMLVTAVTSQGLVDPVCAKQAVVVFLVDESEYVGEENFQKMVNFAGDFITNLGPIGSDGVEVGVVLYSAEEDTIPVILPKEYGKGEDSALLSAVQSIPYGWTDEERMIGQGLTKAKTILQEARSLRQQIPMYLVIIASGPADDEAVLEREAASLSAMGVKILAVGVGRDIEEASLAPLVVNDADDIFIRLHYKDLATVTNEMLGKFCNCPVGLTYVEDKGKLKCEDPTAGGACSKQADLVFVFDASGSVGPNNYKKEKIFMASILTDLNIGPNAVQVAAVRYASKKDTKVFIHFNDFTDKGELQTAIVEIPYVRRGGTATAFALGQTRKRVLKAKKGMRKDAPQIVIVITDGRAKDSRKLPKESAKLASVTDAVIAVGIGNGAVPGELLTIAGNEPSRVFMSDNFDDLPKIIVPMLSAFCKCPENHALQDGKCVECEDGYFVKDEKCVPYTPPPPKCQSRFDLVFVLDASGTIGEENFERIKKFAIRVINKIGNLDENNNQVAVLRFSALNATSEEIKLNEFHGRDALEDKIEEMDYTPRENTFLGLGLDMVRRKTFSPEHGGRKDVPQVVVVVTDADATDQRRVPAEIYLLRQMGVEMFVVGLGEYKKPDKLLALGFNKDKNVYDLNQESDIVSKLKKIGEDACRKIT